MKRLAKLLFVGLLALIPAGARPSTASQHDGWVSLFDGTSLSGWTMGGGRDGKSKWEVVDGAIVGTGTASMLYSPKGEYKNFRFRAEVKINDHGNSGMYFRSPTNDGDFSKGYEAQIDSTHRDPIRTGSIYGFRAHLQAACPARHLVYLRGRGGRQGLEGTQGAPHQGVGQRRAALQFIERTKAWDKGYFAFQQHDPGSKVEIRRSRCKELNEQGK